MEDGLYGSDVELVEGLRRGEEPAAEAFVERYYPLICATLARIMKSNHQGHAADLEDESIIVAERLIRKVAGMKPVTKLRALVAKTAFNEGIDWYRKERRRLEHEAGEDASEVSPTRVHNDARNDDEVRAAEYVPINVEAAAVFEQALATLEGWEQRLLALRASGIAYDEIASVLRDDKKPVKIETWRKRYERAYEKLLAACEKFAEGNPTVLQALAEGQQQIQEKKKSTAVEAS